MSDPNLASRQNRFVGICIRREKEGLHHNFTLRNVIDGLGLILKLFLIFYKLLTLIYFIKKIFFRIRLTSNFLKFIFNQVLK